MFRRVKKVHFVGIGGIGMSGIAELLLNLGFDVSGSDITESPIIEKLIRLGADVHMGHSVINLTDADVLVYSSAVQKDNPEIQAAYEKNIPVIRRAEMLGELIAVKETSIGVGGTHGKTTTSSMIGIVLTEGHLDPTLVVGGLVKTIDSNAALADNAQISQHDTEQNYVYETMTQDQKANMYDFISNFEGAKQKKKLTPKKTKKAKGSTLEMFMGV